MRHVHRPCLACSGCVGDLGAHDDERRAFVVVFGLLHGSVQRLAIVAVGHVQHLPTVALEAPGDVVATRQVGAAFDGDAVVVEEADELAELQMAGERRRFVRDALHEIAIAGDEPGVVVHQRVLCGVETRCQVRFGQRHADRVGHALSQRSGGGFDTGGVVHLGMTWGLAVPLPEVLQVVEAQVVTRKVQQAVQQHRRMTA